METAQQDERYVLVIQRLLDSKRCDTAFFIVITVLNPENLNDIEYSSNLSNEIEIFIIFEKLSNGFVIKRIHQNH